MTPEALTWDQELGARLRTAREVNHLSLADVEALTAGEIKRATLSAYERGERAVTARLIERLANLYRRNVREFFDAPIPFIVGLDVSATSTGVAHIDGATATIKTSLKAGDEDRFARRLIQIEQALEDVLLGPTGGPPPDLVVIEGYNLGPVKGKLALVRLGEVGGIVRGLCFRRMIRYVEVPPSSLKLYATGKGNADKDAMEAAAHAAGAGVDNHDEADAWWLRAMALHHYADQAPDDADITRRSEALKSIDWPTIPAKT